MKKEYDIALSFSMQEKDLVERVYHYLKAEGYSVFFAPAPECQEILSARNQREVFYEVFGLQAEYVALFVSSTYVERPVTMEECEIAITKHGPDGKVIPIYMDEAKLPARLLNPAETNYYKSNSAIEIANHLANKMKRAIEKSSASSKSSEGKSGMVVRNNTVEKQVNIGSIEGDINLW